MSKRSCDSCRNASKSPTCYPCCVCNSDRNKYKPMTNADRIRNMTDEELADILFDDCTDKMGLEMCKYIDNGSRDCKECVLEWLQAEVEEGEE